MGQQQRMVKQRGCMQLTPRFSRGPCLMWECLAPPQHACMHAFALRSRGYART